MRFPHLAHRSAAAHKLHSTPQQDRINLISGNRETSSRLPALAYSPRKLSRRPAPSQWTVKHEWVYLRPAANGIEQKRSLAEFFDWYNLRRPHQALSWRTPDEAYLGQSMAATALAA